MICGWTDSTRVAGTARSHSEHHRERVSLFIDATGRAEVYSRSLMYQFSTFTTAGFSPWSNGQRSTAYFWPLSFSLSGHSSARFARPLSAIGQSIWGPERLGVKESHLHHLRCTKRQTFQSENPSHRTLFDIARKLRAMI